MAHLEKEIAYKEEGTETEDPNGIKGVTKELIVQLAKAVKDAQQEENPATTAATWSTLSVNAHWGRYLEQIHI